MALKGLWMTTQEDMAAFASWAYDADPVAVKQRMLEMIAPIKK